MWFSFRKSSANWRPTRLTLPDGLLPSRPRREFPSSCPRRAPARLCWLMVSPLNCTTPWRPMERNCSSSLTPSSPPWFAMDWLRPNHPPNRPFWRWYLVHFIYLNKIIILALLGLAAIGHGSTLVAFAVVDIAQDDLFGPDGQGSNGRMFAGSDSHPHRFLSTRPALCSSAEQILLPLSKEVVVHHLQSIFSKWRHSITLKLK